jgi:hypothetical protein
MRIARDRFADYCAGLLATAGRHSVEPMAVVMDPGHISKPRTAQWLPAAEAAALVGNDQLHDLIRLLEARKTSSHRKYHWSR